MATIEPYQTSTGQRRYRVRYRTPDRKQTTRRGFRTKRDAELWLANTEVSKAKGEYVDITKSRVTVGEWAERWFDGKANLASTTRDRYRGVLDAHILPSWAKVRLCDVAHDDVQAWITKLCSSGRLDALKRRKMTGRGARPETDGPSGLSAASVVKTHRVLSMILDYAVKDGRLARNPAQGVDLPTATGAEKRYLTADQVDVLADAAGVGRLVVLTLAYCGLRWGELAALKVSRLDLMKRRLHVAENVVEVGTGFLEWKLPKDHERRWVPLPRFLAQDLAAHVAGKEHSDLVFTGRDGAVLRNGSARRAWFDDAVKKTNLPEGLAPHELRHTAASLAVSAGANVKAVQRMLGHKKASMTLDVYADLFDDDLETVAERLDDMARESRKNRKIDADSPRDVVKMWSSSEMKTM